MADKKISQLTAATTPLAGTEVLPIVQGGSTVKVSVADLTAGRATSASAFTSTADSTFNGVLVGRGAGGISDNVKVGAGALIANTTGSGNTAIGNSALNKNTTGAANSAFGGSAFDANTTGGSNVGVGFFAGLSNTTGSENTAVGVSALRLNSTAGNNSAFGSGALYAAIGANNTGIGRNSGVSATTGTLNVYVGMNAASAATTGSRNTVVGSDSALSVVGGDDQVVIGNSLTGKGNDTAFIGGTNGAYNEKNVTTWETTSDARIKKNIVDNFDGLERIKAIRVRNFEYRKPDEITDVPASAAIDKEGVQLGVIAQEMLPECVTENSTGVKSVNTDALIWYLVNAVKELSTEIDRLKA